MLDSKFWKKSGKIEIRQAKTEDILGILVVEREAWGKEGAASKEMFESRIRVFPEGILVAVANGEIVGVVVVEKVNYDLENGAYTWYEITDNGFIRNSHRPDGDTIYGVDLSVLPAFQRQGIGTKLLKNIGELAIRHNVRQVMLGERMPDYYQHAEKMSPEEYVIATTGFGKEKRFLDPEINFYKKAGLEIVKIIPNYFKDPKSKNYGVLLLWKNPFYNKWYRWIVVNIFRI